ncbi:MAG: GNAT family N-acetyltransferase [Acidobacteria bacterium]|nr:GNAT family N-acetyltransferase [Acidobacteriota bacterium]
MAYTIRPAVSADIPALRRLIELSVRGLQAADYSPTQRERALAEVYGVDTQLIADGTYYVAETRAPEGVLLVGAGGWSRHKTLFGGDRWSRREDELLDPGSDAARIRAFFVHPEWARRGVATLLLEACEQAARRAGFSAFEMGATLTGVPMYKARGYVELATSDVPLAGGEVLRIVHMRKEAG